MGNYVGSSRLTYLWGKIKNYVSTYVSLASSTNNDLTTNTLTVGSTSVTIPNRVSQLSNDSGFLTSHQDISGKANASEMAVSTSGDKTTITLKTGTSATVLNAHQDISGKVDTTSVGAANGVCPLDANALIDSQYLPSFVDDVVEAYIVSGATALGSGWLATGSASGTVITPSAGKIYVIMNGNDTYPTNSQYRWGGSAYVKLNDGGMSEMTEAEMDAATNNWS